MHKLKTGKEKFWILIILVLAVVIVLLLTKTLSINSLFARKYPVQGVDVSHYQGTIDWKTLEEQKISFAFIKATEGSGYVDEEFYNNWENARETGLYLGAYHFFSFDSKGEAQAEHYISTVGSLAGKLAPVVDIEYYGDKERNPPQKEEVTRELGEFLRRLEEHYLVKPVIYTTYKVHKKYIEGTFNEYPLWIRNVYYPPDVDKKDSWQFWQYSDTAVLEGYRGSEPCIDKNVFSGSLEELEKFVVSGQ